MVPLTAYVYRQAIFRPGYCFTKRQPERTSYTTDRHHQRSGQLPISVCISLSRAPYTTSLHRSSCTIFSRLAAGVASCRPSTPTREPRSVSQSNEFRCAILTRCCCFYARSLYFSAAALLMMIVLACSKRLSIEKRLDRLLKHYVAAKCKT